MQFSSALDIIFACLVPLFPISFLGYSIGGGIRNFFLGSTICGFLGVYLCWHAGIAGFQGEQFSPFWGLIPVFFIEVHNYLQHRRDLSKKSLSSIGDRFTMLDNSVIRLPSTAPLLGLLVGIATSFVISQTGTAMKMSLLVNIFHYSICKGILILLGILFFTQFLGLSRITRGSASQSLFNEAKALHENTVSNKYSHALKPDTEVEQLRQNPALLKAQELYLMAAEADKKVDYGTDNFQQLLNQSITYCQLALLHRQWQQLKESAAFAKQTYEILEPYRKDRPHDKELLTCLSAAYFRFAEANHVLGNKSIAKDYYKRSLNIDEKLGDIAGKQQTESMMKKL